VPFEESGPVDLQTDFHTVTLDTADILKLQKTVGVDLLVECGPSRGLVRNSKFIPGKFTFCDLSSVTTYLPPSTVS
jgi:hypothetical protein